MGRGGEPPARPKGPHGDPAAGQSLSDFERLLRRREIAGDLTTPGTRVMRILLITLIYNSSDFYNFLFETTVITPVTQYPRGFAGKQVQT
jgi:hypothetical protein